jgi:hypothetical protein
MVRRSRHQIPKRKFGVVFVGQRPFPRIARLPVHPLCPEAAPMTINFNRFILAAAPVNTEINAVIERAHAAVAEMPRYYLGASIVGEHCARKVQFDWWCKPELPARVRRIFDRGHFFEAHTREQLVAAGFVFSPSVSDLAFTACNDDLQGHADGLIIAGPALPTVRLDFPALWECKALNAKNWRAVERDGLDKAFPKYSAQVSLYQAYLNRTNPALFTVVNADTCELLHFTMPFSAEQARYWSDRAALIIDATRAGKLLPRFTNDPDDWRCRICQHKERCWR